MNTRAESAGEGTSALPKTEGEGRDRGTAYVLVRKEQNRTIED